MMYKPVIVSLIDEDKRLWGGGIDELSQKQ